jgi:phosphatidylinositol 4-kinase A
MPPRSTKPLRVGEYDLLICILFVSLANLSLSLSFLSLTHTFIQQLSLTHSHIQQHVLYIYLYIYICINKYIYIYSLVDDVLGQDVSDKVPMEKVIMLLWSFRDDPSVVTFMARFVQKYSGSRHVFDGIEFYLPQLAHMIIHLEVEWDDAILERLTLVIAQQSLHFALQFNWILQGALQDYHPETFNPHTNQVMPNPNYSPLFYSRCLKLLKNVERVVVYGKPRAQELQKLYETGKISKQEMQILELADRRFISLQITNDDDDAANSLRHVGALDGMLLVKLPTPTSTTSSSSSSSSSSPKTKSSPDFVPRFCVLEKHVLNCYKMKQGCSNSSAPGKLDRAMSLEKANVQIIASDNNSNATTTSASKAKMASSSAKTTKAANTTTAAAKATATTTTANMGSGMEILVTTRNYEFRLRCSSPEECKLWARRLGEEADASALFPTHNAHHYSSSSSSKDNDKQQDNNVQDESNLTSSFASTITATNTTNTTTVARFQKDLTPAQLDRYHFFQNERLFVDQLTRVAEDLRDQNRAERKALAPKLMMELQIPTTTAIYLPLCNSSDIWRRVHETIAHETRVFNTKERCPTVMHFITKRGETVNKIQNSGGGGGSGTGITSSATAIRVDPNLDVAEYMHAYLDVNLDNDDAMDATTATNITTSVIAEGDEQEESKKEEEEATQQQQPQASGISDAPSPPPHSQGMEISADGKAVADDKNKSGDMVNSVHGSVSNVWVEEEEDEGDDDSESRRKGGGNSNRVQRMIRESVVTIPTKFAKRLNPRSLQSRRLSIMDQQTVVQPLVPILEGSRAAGGGAAGGGGTAGDEFGENASIGDGTVVSVERSSILIKDTGAVLLGDLQEGDIDIESIDRAKQHVCGGEVWAEKSARMLEEALKRDQLLAQGQGDKNGSEEHNSNHSSISKDNVQLEIASCLAKSNDDLRQEVFVMQMIHYYKSVFAQARLPLWLKTYRILSTSSSEGLLELLTDANSLDGIKKSDGYPKEGGLRAYFEKVYGGPDSKSFKAAQRNFMTSLAGYAIVSYLLGLKDRHNGNIMIDTRGHLIFIDFGFALGMAPGHEFSMERAPFKLTKEMVQVMGGVGSDCYKEFETLFVAGFEEARKNYQIALGLVEIMMFKSNYPCFSGWRYGNGKALVGLEKRLMLHVPDKHVKRRALNLIKRSRQHIGTYLYDKFQHATNGYAM